MRYGIIEVPEGGAILKEISPLERAIEYIENHLNENIGLSDVSRETGYSYYHMTRLFSSVLGESVGRYINRRRLYNASKKLIHSDQRVIDIALDCGFESPEAFSRAFKAAFGSSPIDYRRAGLRGTTSLSDNRLPGLWAEFTRLHKDLFTAAGTGYAICETQQTTYTKDGNVLFAVMVGSPVNDFDRLPQSLSLVKKVLQAGKYAVFTHRGTFANLFKTYQYIFGTWLPTAGVELDDREDFEVYEREVLSFDDPNNEVKIYIPIK